MAIAFVQVGFANPQTTQISVPVTFTNPQGAGNLNVIAIGWNDATSTISSVTDTNGNTYTLCNAIARATTISQAMYYAKNITGGSNTVTVVFNVTTTFIDIRALEYSGIDTTSPLDQVAVGTGNNSAATPTTANTGTTSVANEVLVAGGYANHSYTAAGAGYTSRIITPLNAKIAEDEIVAATGIYNATATIGQSSNWIIQLATFKAAASGKIVAALNGSASVSLLNLSKGFISSNTSLSFTDNFNTGSLNPRWVIDTGAAPGTIAGINTGTFSAAFVDMTQNVLALKVTQTGSAPVISTGAEVRSINTFGFGSYEWSMRASSTATTPGGAGSVTSGQISSGFTFINNSQTEIDSPEIEGQSPKAIEWTNFSGVANKQTSTTNVAFSPDQGFHTYKFIWQPTQIDFYIDGIHVDFHNTNIPITPAFILFNHWGTNSTGFGGLATTGVTRWLYFNKFSFVPLAAIGSSVVAAVLRGAVFQSALVSWNASSGATSYNVKRANALAGPYSNRGTVAGTTFTDYDLFLQGNTYYYEVTAVNAAGESGPSTIVPVSIPISSTLAANFSGNCFVNAVSKALGKVVSPIIGDANVNATVIAKGKIISAITGSGAVTAIAKSPGGIISHIFGTSSVSGTVKATGKVVSAISGHGSVTAAIASKGIILSSITGHATVSGTGRRLGVLKSNILGTSSVQASTFVGAMVSNIFGAGTVNATIKAAPHTILSNITGTGSVVSTIKGLGKIVSSTTGHGTVNSAIIAKGLIASAITGHGSVTGTFHITGGIISHILGTSAVTAQVNAKGIIVSGITGHSAVTAVVTNSSHSSSAITGSSAVTGTLKSKSFIASNIHGIGSLFVFQYISVNNVEVTANPETPGTWVAAIIRITNIGNTSMTWAASTDIYWLTAVLPSGVLPNNGDTVDIPIVVNMPGAFFPFPEPLTAHVTITANVTGFPRVIEIDVAPIVRVNTVGNEPGEWKSPIRFGLGSSLQW